MLQAETSLQLKLARIYVLNVELHQKKERVAAPVILAAHEKRVDSIDCSLLPLVDVDIRQCDFR